MSKLFQLIAIAVLVAVAASQSVNLLGCNLVGCNADSDCHGVQTTVAQAVAGGLPLGQIVGGLLGTVGNLLCKYHINIYFDTIICVYIVCLCVF